MGTYWNIENTKAKFMKFYEIYKRHRKLNKDQFRDDFGHINSATDIWCSGLVKVGVREKKFYTKSFRDEIKRRFKIVVS